MSRAPIFRWTPERAALLARLYREDGWQVDEIAALLAYLTGQPIGPRVVTRKVAADGLAKGRDPAMVFAQRSAVGHRSREARRRRDAAAGKFTWNDDRIATCRRLYLDEKLTGQEIADRLGNGCNARQVVAMTSRLGLPALRDPLTTAAVRTEIIRKVAGLGAAATSRKWAQARATGFAPRRPAARPVKLQVNPGVDADMRALIDAAVAAGKVTVLPAGTAAGLSQVERLFHAAPASGGGGWKAAQRSTAPMRRQAGA